MNELETAWLAGLLEGEAHFGTYYLRDRALSPQLSVVMTDRDVIERVAAMWGVTVTLDKPAKPELNRKAQYRARIRGKRAAEIMRKVLPMMGERRQSRITEILSASNRAVGTGNWKRG